MKYYVIKLDSDNGIYYLKTNASDKATAIENCMLVENCPRIAIKGIKEITLGLWSMSGETLYENSKN
jgi:hypothetical protein